MNNTKETKAAYLVPSAETINLIESSLLCVSTGGSEGGGGNENYAPALDPFGDTGLFDSIPF